MSNVLQVDERMARLIEAIYETDESEQRRQTLLHALAPRPGERVLDIGTGPGFVANAIADVVGPTGSVLGIDISEPMLQLARKRCAAKAKNYPGVYDLICMFDCFHDMGDPIGAASHVHKTLAPGGSYMLVEPMAADRLEDNLNPLRRLAYAGSTMICVPTSLAQEVGLALGAVAGEKRLREALMAGGFTSVRRAAETPTNMILDIRP